jgi:uncharacterized protein DUF3485
MKSSTRFAVLLVLLLFAGAVVNAWSYLGEARVERKDLSDFPQSIGAWQRTGTDRILDDETLSVLRASDYLLRDFRKPEGQVANLYVEPGKATIPLPDGTSFVANKYVIQNGDYQNLMIYWYQGRGRNVASEYWGKIYTVFDSVRLRRSDGAMVRVTVPIGNSVPAAEQSAVEFAAAASAVLPEFVP